MSLICVKYQKETCYGECKKANERNGMEEQESQTSRGLY